MKSRRFGRNAYANLSTVFGTKNDTSKFVARYLKATHCDLFFADAAIFVEGQAERILIPQFIRKSFPDLNRRYITLLDLGGSHAHTFKSLVQELGLTTLVISDLDAATKELITNKKGHQQTVEKGASPALGKKQVTTNPVLKKWHPKITEIDELAALPASGHILGTEQGYSLYVAYQKPVEIYEGTTSNETLIPRTFEDALVYANLVALSDVRGSSISAKIKVIIDQELPADALKESLFELLKGAQKAAFALDCLMIESPTELVPPLYISDGLSWLENYLTETASDVEMVPSNG
jgi:predicted ATP-dependent endonuclease of OLD family